jgi:hypothetical protein
MTSSGYIRKALLFAAAALALGATSAQAITLEGEVTPDLQKSAEAGVATFPSATDSCPNVRFTFSDEGQELPGQRWEAWADEFNCRVNFRSSLKGASFWTLCPIVVHEFGHLAKLTFPDNPEHPSHSADPTNIMYPTGPASVWPLACGPAREEVKVTRGEEESETDLEPYLLRAFKLQDWLLVHHQREVAYKATHCQRRVCRQRVSRRFSLRAQKARRQLARLKDYLAKQGAAFGEYYGYWPH